jgi:hypothetical protein
MQRTTLSLSAIIALAGCSAGSTQQGPELVAPAPEQECDASTAQEFLGEPATQELGAILMERTGALVLRWIPPNTGVTMDYRVERLNVSYGEDMIIEMISCG